jgi:dTDP-3,4-didehydro-2,6-dideoxy-alpha-D-glucose 3-reductase
MTVRIGVLGCADIAWRRTLPAMSAANGVELVAVASRTAEKAKRFAARFGCVAVAGYEDLLARDDIDAVYLPLPAMLHAEWITRALSAGKHVLAEKPMTGDHATTVRLLDQARAAGLVLMENFMFLQHTQHTRVRDLLSAIGQLRYFSSTFTIPPKTPEDIRYRPDIGGGALLDIGVYPLRAALRFLGPGLQVTGATMRVREVVLGGDVLLHTPHGVAAHVSFGMEHAYRTSYEFAGCDGVLATDRVFTPPATYQPVVTITRQNRREELTLPSDDQVSKSIRSFADAVTGSAPDHLEEETIHLARLVGEIERRAVVHPAV